MKTHRPDERFFGRTAGEIRRSVQPYGDLQTARDVSRRLFMVGGVAALGYGLAARPRSVSSSRQGPRPILPINSPVALSLEEEGVVLLWGEGRPMTEPELQATWEDLQRVSPALRRACLNDAPLELLSGDSIQAYHRYRSESGEFPGRPGTTWGEIAGIAASDLTVVLVNHNLRGHARQYSLLLHEVGHQFDRKCGRPSARSQWQALHRVGRWRSNYAAKFPAESFADAFAAYFYSDATRNALPSGVRAFLEEQLGSEKWRRGEGGDACVMPRRFRR